MCRIQFLSIVGNLGRLVRSKEFNTSMHGTLSFVCVFSILKYTIFLAHHGLQNNSTLIHYSSYDKTYFSPQSSPLGKWNLSLKSISCYSMTLNDPENLTRCFYDQNQEPVSDDISHAPYFVQFLSKFDQIDTIEKFSNKS